LAHNQCTTRGLLHCPVSRILRGNLVSEETWGRRQDGLVWGNDWQWNTVPVMASKPPDPKRMAGSSVDCLILAATRAGKPFFFWSTRQLPAWQQRYLAVTLGAAAAALVARLAHQAELLEGPQSQRFLCESDHRVWCVDLSITDCVMLASVGKTQSSLPAPQRHCKLQLFRSVCLSLLPWLRRALLCQLQARVFATLRYRPAFDVHRYIDADLVSQVFEVFWDHPLAYTLELLPLSGPLLYPSQRCCLFESIQRVVSLVEEQIRPLRVTACLLLDLVAMGVMVARMPAPFSVSHSLLMMALVSNRAPKTCIRMQVPGEQPQYLLVAGSERYRLVYATECAVSPTLFEQTPIQRLHDSILQMASSMHHVATEMLLSPLMNMLLPRPVGGDNESSKTEPAPETAQEEPAALVLAAVFQKSRKLIGTNTNRAWNRWLFDVFQEYEARHQHRKHRTRCCLTTGSRHVYCFPEVLLYGESCTILVGVHSTIHRPDDVFSTDEIPSSVEAVLERWTRHLQQLSLHSPILRDTEQEPEWYLMSGFRRLLLR
jgi:hypothetical protein